MGFLDLPKVKLVEKIVLKRFDGDVQDDEHLAEVLVMEDGKVIDYWCRKDQRLPADLEAAAVILNPPEAS